MSKIINILLMILKWPMAILSVALIIPALKTDMIILYQDLTLKAMTLCGLPILAVGGLWFIFPNLKNSFLTIFIHELTHMFFAILTGHRPKDIMVKSGQGGAFVYEGIGNWLIDLSPYFFPLIVVFLMGCGAVYTFTDQPKPDLYWVFYGLSVGFYMMATFAQIHIGQTDFKSAGRIFSCLFLPGANLICYGFILAYACSGFSGFIPYIQELIAQFQSFVALF